MSWVQSMDMERFNIKAIVKYSGVNAHTLRAWERRYQVIRPSREQNGRRMYSLEDAERLKLLATLVSEGHAISHLAKLTDDDLRSLVARTKGEGALPTRTSTLDRKLPPVDSNRLLSLVDEGSLEPINEELSRVRRAIPGRLFVLKVASPLMQRVRAAKLDGRISATQAQSVAVILRLQLAELLESLRSTAQSSPLRIAVVGIGEDCDPVTLKQVAVLCAARGHGCWWMGWGISPEAAAETAKALKAGIVLAGSRTIEALSVLDRGLPESTAIWSGFDGPSLINISRTTVEVLSLEDLDRKLG